MSFYKGDYRPGLYAASRGMRRGDPGFFSFLGSLAKSAVSLIPGVGPIASEAISKVGGSIFTRMAGHGRGIVKAGSEIISKHPVLTGAAAAGAAAGVGGLAGAAIEKHLRGGGKKHRRMNVYNPRALRRAVRRSLGFARMAKKVLHIQHRFKSPKRWGHMGHFKKRSRKS